MTGPTGSGKTTTLYAALNDLNRPTARSSRPKTRSSTTCRASTRCEVEHSIGLDFARIIRSMLRQAPNVILVGEMRDSRDGGDGNSSFFDWTLGIQYTTYEQCARSYYTHGRHGSPRLSGRQQRDCDHGAAAWCGWFAPNASSPTSPSDAVLEAAGIRREMAEKANF